MKQPELGKKIAELRKSKGLTQEELVDLCNISVRTIQRIETGEVTPRSYTVKTILGALESNYDEFGTTIKVSKKALGILTTGMVAGILYFILRFFEATAEYARFVEYGFNPGYYLFAKLSVLICFILFQRGLMHIGDLFDNYLLSTVTKVMMGVWTLVIGLDIASVFFFEIEPEYIMITYALAMGASGILFGYSLTRLKSLGNVPMFAGIVEIVAGFFSITVILSFFSLFILVLAEILEIILIFRAIEILKKET